MPVQYDPTFSFVPGLSRDDGWGSVDKDTLANRAREDLDCIAARNASVVSWAKAYATMYQLTIFGHGSVAYVLICATLRRMARCHNKVQFLRGATLIRDVAMYLEKVWVPKQKLPHIMDVAETVYERPVAVRWRRALAHAKWSVRVRKWRVAWDMIVCAPGRSGAIMAAKHFREMAEKH